MSLDETRSTRRQRVEEKERAILAAARRAFEEKGFDRARMADIAAAVGAAEGTIYTYYPNKDALFRAMLAEFWAGITGEIEAAVGAAPSPSAQLDAVAEAHVQVCQDNWSFFELTSRIVPGRSRDAQTRALMRDYVAIFDRVVGAARDRRELTEAALGWIARDQFYGSLEYAARTQTLRGGGPAEEISAPLVAAFRAAYGRTGEADPLEARLARLEAAAVRRIGPARRAGQ